MKTNNIDLFSYSDLDQNYLSNVVFLYHKPYEKKIFEKPTDLTTKIEYSIKERFISLSIEDLFMKDRRIEMLECKISDDEGEKRKYRTKLQNIVNGVAATIGTGGFVYATYELSKGFRVEPLFGAIGSSLLFAEIFVGIKYDQYVEQLRHKGLID